MNASDIPLPLPRTLIIRAGCLLAYEAQAPATLLLAIRPQPGEGQFIVDEKLECKGASVQASCDAYGNPVWRATLAPGRNEIRFEALVVTPAEAEPPPAAGRVRIEELDMDVLRYTFPSRYCESDKLAQFAQQRFGRLAPGGERVSAIVDWVHEHIAYRYGSGSQTLSACDTIVRGYGVCRDFAHVTIALCRALDIPARYVAGHVPLLAGQAEDACATIDCGAEFSDIGIDFHAYAEVHLDGRWQVVDARFNRPMPGRIKLAHGLDAVDAAFATIYGPAIPVHCSAWSHEEQGVPQPTVLL